MVLKILILYHFKLPNGVRYPLMGGMGFGLGARFRLGVDKSPKMPQNPASQAPASLGAFFSQV
jgi:hypothetical protein